MSDEIEGKKGKKYFLQSIIFVFFKIRIKALCCFFFLTDSNENKSILRGKCPFVIMFTIIINNEIGINGIILLQTIAPN